MAEPKILSVEQISNKDLMVLRSLIRLMGSDLSHSWELATSSENADAKVVDVDSEAGTELWETLSRNGETPVALSRDRDFPANRLLHKPLRSRQLISVLNQITDSTGDTGDRTSVRPMVLGLKPDNLPLAEHLRRGTWRQPFVFEGWQKPPVIIDPGSGAWYSKAGPDDLDALLGAILTPESGTPLSSAQLVEQTASLPQQPLSDLKWAAGLKQSTGGLHPDLMGEVSFMLTHVPRHARESERHLRLARALTGEACQFEELRDNSGEEPESIATFLNACHACGHLLVKRRGSQSF